MQSFTIPGSTSLSVLAGALFGLGRGFVVVSVVAAVGASVAFFFSWLLGKRLVVKYFPENVDKVGCVTMPSPPFFPLFFFFFFFFFLAR